MQRQIALFALPILATVWAASLGVLAARRKAVLERIMYCALALLGAVIAAAGWYLLCSAMAGESN